MLLQQQLSSLALPQQVLAFSLKATKTIAPGYLLKSLLLSSSLPSNKQDGISSHLRKTNHKKNKEL
jgi:hypothetical protein